MNNYHQNIMKQRALRSQDGLSILEHQDSVPTKSKSRKVPLPSNSNDPEINNIDMATECIQASLSWNQNGSIRALLDTSKNIPIVFITAINRFNQSFYLSISYQTFLDRTIGESKSREEEEQEQEPDIDIDRQFLLRTTQIADHIVSPIDMSGNNKLLWLDTQQEIEHYNERRRVRAAIRIQAVTRGNFGRMRINAVIFRNSSIAIQKQWLEERAFVRSLRDLSMLSEDFNRINATMNGSTSATKIQARVRTHQQRHLIEYKKQRKLVLPKIEKNKNVR
jgi:hypothetical protein